MIHKKNNLLRKYKILLIEDSANLLQFYETLFQIDSHNISFFTVRSGDTALDLLKKGSFDLLITDLWHCGNSGIPFLEMLKEEYPNLPVIVCSGYSSTDKVEDAFKAGAQDYIIKPFRPSCLLQTIYYLLVKEKRGSCYLKQSLIIVCDRISRLLSPKCKSEWGLIGLKDSNLLTIEECSEALIKPYQITPPPYVTDIPDVSTSFPMDSFTEATVESIQSNHIIDLNFPTIEITKKDYYDTHVLNLSHLFCIPISPPPQNIQCLHLFPYSNNFSLPSNWPIILKQVENTLTSLWRPLVYL